MLRFMHLFNWPRAVLLAAFGVLTLPAVHAAELLGYYAFEGDYTDSTGNENHAEPSQNPDQLSFGDGFRGQGLDIQDPDAEPNSGGSVDLPIDANPVELPGVTFGGWVNVAENFEFDGFMATDNGGWDRGITVNAQESNAFGIASGAAPTHIGDIVPGEWQYVVGTFDATEGMSTLYVGSAMTAIQTTESASGGDATDLGEPVIELGRYDNQDYNGLVDDIFVFDEALDAHHVNAIRNLRLGAANYSPPQVAALFDLFATGSSGVIEGTQWEPVTGLNPAQPGALISQGLDGIALVLDDAGNGMLGDRAGFPAEDTDDDGLDDFWELTHFGNLAQDGAGDPDEDGLSNSEELEAGTLPSNKDTDRDGLDDGAEIATHGTDPLNADTDGDGVSDGAEVATGTDPTDAASVPKPPAAPLLAFYDFESELEDASGNGNTASAAQNPDEVTFIDGFRGQGADINDPTEGENNSGGTINIPVDANPDALPDVTFGGWINVEAFEFDGFMAIDNGGWDRGITVNAQDSNAFGIASGAGPTNVGEITPGEWQYVVGTFSDASGLATLYVGSAEESMQTTETAVTDDLGRSPGEPEIEIGRYDNQDLDAIVDDIFVFGGALDAHHVNALRNLRLSAIDYSPGQVAQLFELFADNSAGSIDGFLWSPVSELAADVPGEVVDIGGAFTVVLDDVGNGMLSGAAPRFEITSMVRMLDPASVILTWNSRQGRVYAVDVSADLSTWTEIVAALPPAGDQTSHTDPSADIATTTERYYRVREDVPPPLFVEDFESGAPDWTVGIIETFSETGTTWELGTPDNNGPAAAFSGTAVYGTDLDANYEDGTGIYLRSPVIDLTGAGRTRLEFQYFMAAGDEEGGRLNVLEANGTAILPGLKLYIGPGGNTGDWTSESIRLPDLDRPVIFEFELLSGADDDPINRAGWFIDDLVVD